MYSVWGRGGLPRRRAINGSGQPLPHRGHSKVEWSPYFQGPLLLALGLQALSLCLPITGVTSIIPFLFGQVPDSLTTGRAQG